MKIVLIRNDGSNDEIVADLEVQDISTATGDAGIHTTLQCDEVDGKAWTLVFDDAAVLGLIMDRHDRLQTARDVLRPLNKHEATRALHRIYTQAFPMDRCEKKETDEIAHASRRCALAANHRTQCIFGSWTKD